MAVQPIDDATQPQPTAPKTPTATEPVKPPMTPPASPTPTPIPLNPPALAAANPTPPTPPMPAPAAPVTPEQTAYRASEFGQSQINSGTAATLAQNAGGMVSANGALPTAGLALPPVTPDNWQGAQGRIDAQQKSAEQASAAAGLSDMQNGYNLWETQAQLNARRGLTVNPTNGSYDDPNTRAPSSAGAAAGAPAPASPAQPWSGPNDATGGFTARLPYQGEILGHTEGENIARGYAKKADGSYNPLDRYDAGASGGSPSLQGAAGPTNAPGIGPAQGGVSSGASGGIPGVGQQTIVPDSASDLRNKMILPDAGVDRFKLAQDRFDTMSKASDPAYQASLRSATQRGAANGTLGSGMLNTDYGNLAEQRGRDLDQSRNTLLQNALEGTIDDGRSNRNEVRGERGYENGLENQAYTRGVQGLTLEDALTNSAFGRAQGQYAAGNQSNPASTQLALSALYGQNAGIAGQSVAGYTQANAANAATKKALTPLQTAIYGPQGNTPQGGPSQAVLDAIGGN